MDRQNILEWTWYKSGPFKATKSVTNVECVTQKYKVSCLAGS